MGCSASTPPARSSKKIADDCFVLDAPEFHDKYSLGAKALYGAIVVQYRVACIRGDGREHKKTERDWLVKIVDMNVTPQTVRDEVDIWHSVSGHPNLASLQEVFFGEHLCYMVTELSERDLLPHLKSMQDSVNERSLGEIFVHMLSGLAHIHAAGIAHRNINPSIFCVGGGKTDIVKISDFGSAAHVRKSKLHGICGQGPFASPEMLLGKGYDEKTDMWSFAVIAYALLFGTLPYIPADGTSKAMLNKINRSRPKFHPSRFAEANDYMRSESAIRFVKGLLQQTPEQRFSARQALDSDYMVAVQSNTHECGRDLPSLQPMYEDQLWLLLRWDFPEKLKLKLMECCFDVVLRQVHVDKLIDRMQKDSGEVKENESERVPLNYVRDGEIKVKMCSVQACGGCSPDVTRVSGPRSMSDRQPRAPAYDSPASD